MPKGFKLFLWIFAGCFACAMALAGYWFYLIARVPGVYSLSESSSCNVLSLNQDGTYRQRVDLYEGGRKGPTLSSQGRWTRTNAHTLSLSGSDFLDDRGQKKQTETLVATSDVNLLIFHLLTINLNSGPLTLHKPLTGTTACMLAGLS